MSCLITKATFFPQFHSIFTVGQLEFISPDPMADFIERSPISGLICSGQTSLILGSFAFFYSLNHSFPLHLAQVKFNKMLNLRTFVLFCVLMRSNPFWLFLPNIVKSFCQLIQENIYILKLQISTKVLKCYSFKLPNTKTI